MSSLTPPPPKSSKFELNIRDSTFKLRSVNIKGNLEYIRSKPCDDPSKHVPWSEFDATGVQKN